MTKLSRLQYPWQGYFYLDMWGEDGGGTDAILGSGQGVMQYAVFPVLINSTSQHCSKSDRLPTVCNGLQSS